MRLRFLYRAFKARYRDQRHELRAVRTLIQRGDTVVDIGANKGAYLYWLQKARFSPSNLSRPCSVIYSK